MTESEFLDYMKYKKMIEEEDKKWQQLRSVIGGGYDEFCHSRHRYRVVKGGRGSKKSTTGFTELPWRIMNYPLSNAVVVRKTYNTHKDSTYAEIQKGCQRLGVYDKFKFTVNPFEITYLPTGQKILFRGFDEVMKLTSINVAHGYLCWVYLEEVFEIEDEKDFDTLDESIRGMLPPHLWHQLTLLYNPWINSHWTKTRFWDKEYPNTFRLTTTHKNNEFLSQADHDKLEALKETDPERYLVVGLGEYGIPGGAYFDEFRKDIHVCKPFIIPKHWTRFTCMDYGLDMFAHYWGAIDENSNVYIYKEIHKDNLVISEACEEVKRLENETVVSRYAPPDLWNRRQETGKSAADIFREHGLCLHKTSNKRVQGWYNVKEWIKPIETRDEQTGEVKKVSRLKIFDNCVNLIRCLPQAQKSEKDPNDVAVDPHEITHSIDALRTFCSSRPAPSDPLVESRIDEDDEDEDDLENRSYNTFYA